MSDPQHQEPDAAATESGPTTSEQIERSLGSVWQRCSGQRPKSMTVELDGDRVRCVVEEAPPVAATDDDGDQLPDPDFSPESNRYRNDATAAVARVMRRRVVAYIPKRDAKTDLASQVFILHRPGRKY